MSDGSRFFEECGQTQLTREQAEHFFDIEAWRLLTAAERCGFQVHQEFLAMPNVVFRTSFEHVLGEPMADIAFTKPHFLARSLKAMGHDVPELEEVIGRIPEERRGPLADLVPSQPVQP